MTQLIAKIIGTLIITTLAKSGISQDIQLNAEIDSIITYGPFKAFEPGTKIESKFVEVHLYLSMEVRNYSDTVVKLPKDLYFGKCSTADIFYTVEKYVDSTELFQYYYLGSELPAFRDPVDTDFKEILPGETYRLHHMAYYWIPLDQKHRIRLTANFSFNDPTIRRVYSNWLTIEKTPIKHSIKVIRKNLPE